MNFRRDLQVAAQRHAAARATAAQAEARRDDLIRRAHREGGLSARDMAEPLGLSFQRVATVIASDSDRPLSLTLHGAMRQVLEEHSGDWVTVHELAREIYDRELYRRKDRDVIPPGQVRARAAKYQDLFEGTVDGSNRIRLRAIDKG